MEKLTLDLAELRVETFRIDTSATAERGTVQAHDATNHSCLDTYCCPRTRFATCTC
jgi:hypothetical protein